MKIKHVDCKISKKNANNYRTFRDIFLKLHKEYKGTKEEIVRLQLNEEKSKENETLMS